MKVVREIILRVDINAYHDGAHIVIPRWASQGRKTQDLIYALLPLHATHTLVEGEDIIRSSDIANLGSIGPRDVILLN